MERDFQRCLDLRWFPGSYVLKLLISITQFMKNIKEFIKIYGKAVFIFFLFLVLTIFLSLYKNLESNNTLKIKFLDVGQGDATLIVSPRGQKTLIDTGLNHIINQKVDSTLSIISRKIDNFLLTHPDLDHVGGTRAAIKNNFPKNLLISTENKYEDYQIESIKINNTKNIDIGGLVLEILSPKINQIGDSNHNAIVSQILYGKFKFIFMADADLEIERSLVSQGVFAKKGYITILKVGHHGSDTSSSEIFLKSLKPNYCIISVGKNNRYSHPKQVVMDRLTRYCIEIYRTDEDGGVEFVTDGDRLYIAKDR